MEWNKIVEKGRSLLLPMTKMLSFMPPNILTLSGLAIVALSSVFIGFGKFRIGGLILILGTLLDAIDGEVARRTQGCSKVGAFLDSTLDRYGDFFIFSAIAIAGRGMLLTFLSLASMMGAYITSYTRAKADSLGVEIKNGLFTRVERIIIVIIGLLSGPHFIVYFMVILAIGTNMTAIQRIAIAYKKLKNGGD
ncbi:MAG: CDP-alcohol phosphatidyltransferase family protein [candidate division WOR-3 bacterium]|nr:CDP-alcohol phosphatidyltransferase family protein [candidate division WOR-3 bacterium]